MDEFSSNTNARSAGGHAAYGMKIGEDNRWINIQLNTFTNWVNEQLKKVSLSVRDFRTDFCDGIKLCALIEVLQQKQLKGVNKKPANQHQYLENVVLALRAMVNDDIKLVNIGGEDIVNGNLKLIMGLVWRLILRYQISRGKASPKKFMLAWVNSCIEDYEVTNFTTDWNDGLLLHALLEYCRPGTSPNWRQLNKREGLKNCRTAMELAKHLFDIPLVVRPENMASRELDELSAMTYLSYFTRLGSPGYNSTLRWVQEQIPQKNVSNFQMDWNDGSVVVALVESLGGKVNVATPRGHVPSNKDHVATLQIAMAVAKQQLGVEPVVTAKDMADPAVGHLGVMAYAASFQRASLSEPPPVDIRASLANSREQLSSNFLRPASSSAAADLLDVQVETALYTEMYPVRFSVDAVEGGMDKSQVHVEVHGATTRPSVTVQWKGNRAVCEFLPTESGTYKIYVFNGRHVVRGGPQLINVAPSSHRVERMIELAPPPRMMEVAPPYVMMDNGSPYLMANGAPPLRVTEAAAPLMMTDGKSQPGLRPFSIALPSTGAFLGAQTPIGINAANVRMGNAKVEARSPSGQVHEMSISENDGAYTANFTPTEVGDWNISILYDGQHIQGSPFNVRVFDASQVKVYGLEGGSVENAISFSVDSTAAGEGQLVVSVSHKGRPVPVDVDAEESRGKYRVHFMPDGSGIYEIRVTFAGIEVPGSPFSMDILDTASMQVSGDGLSVAEVNRRARFAISTGDDGSGRHLRIIVTSPRGDRVPCEVALVDDGMYEANYIPTEPGEHRIDITYHGRPIANSPFYVLVTNNNRITVHNLRPTAQLGRPVEFDIDASQGGVGDMEIMINEGQVPCRVQNRGNRLFHAIFTPRDALPHYIDLRFNGMDVPGSPWRVDVISPVPLTVSGPGLGSVRVNTPGYFDVSAPGAYIDPNMVLIQIVGPNLRAVPHQVANSPDGGFSVQYMPVEVGSYTITVSHAGVPAFGSPHVAKAYDCAAIVVNHPRMATVNTPVELTVDVTQAGEGQLEISVNRGTLPNSVKMLRKGVFLVTFTPQEPNMHTVEIKFNSEPLPRGPVEIFVQDPSGGMGGMRSGGRSPANGLSQSQASLNREPNLRTDARKPPHSGFDLSRSKVDLSQVPLADMNVRVTSPNGVLVPAKIVQQPDGDYKVEYSSKFTGRHKVEVHYNGQLIMGSPFFVEIYDPNKIRIEGHKMGVVGQPIEFDIVLNEAGQAELVLTVTSPSGLSVPYNLVPTAVGKRCTYVPQELGPYYVHITYGGLEVPDTSAYGEGESGSGGLAIVTPPSHHLVMEAAADGTYAKADVHCHTTFSAADTDVVHRRPAAIVTPTHYVVTSNARQGRYTRENRLGRVSTCRTVSQPVRHYSVLVTSHKQQPFTSTDGHNDPNSQQRTAVTSDTADVTTMDGRPKQEMKLVAQLTACDDALFVKPSIHPAAAAAAAAAAEGHITTEANLSPGEESTVVSATQAGGASASNDELLGELSSVLKRLHSSATATESRYIDLERGRKGKSVLYVGRRTAGDSQNTASGSRQPPVLRKRDGVDGSGSISMHVSLLSSDDARIVQNNNSNSIKQGSNSNNDKRFFGNTRLAARLPDIVEHINGNSDHIHSVKKNGDGLKLVTKEKNDPSINESNGNHHVSHLLAQEDLSLSGTQPSETAFSEHVIVEEPVHVRSVVSLLSGLHKDGKEDATRRAPVAAGNRDQQPSTALVANLRSILTNKIKIADVTTMSRGGEQLLDNGLEGYDNRQPKHSPPTSTGGGELGPRTSNGLLLDYHPLKSSTNFLTLTVKEFAEDEDNQAVVDDSRPLSANDDCPPAADNSVMVTAVDKLTEGDIKVDIDPSKENTVKEECVTVLPTANATADLSVLIVGMSAQLPPLVNDPEVLDTANNQQVESDQITVIDKEINDDEQTMAVSITQAIDNSIETDTSQKLLQNPEESDDEFQEIERLISSIASESQGRLSQSRDAGSQSVSNKNSNGTSGSGSIHQRSDADKNGVSLKTVSRNVTRTRMHRGGHKQVHSEPKRLSSSRRAAYHLLAGVDSTPVQLSATFPLKRSRGRVLMDDREETGAGGGERDDEQLMDNVFITHSGNYVLPDMARRGADVKTLDGRDVSNRRSHRGRPTNANVTIPRPTSFHSLSNSVGGHLLGQGGRRSISVSMPGYLTLATVGGGGDGDEVQGGHFSSKVLTTTDHPKPVHRTSLTSSSSSSAHLKKSKVSGKNKHKSTVRRTHSADRRLRPVIPGDIGTCNTLTFGVSPRPQRRKRQPAEKTSLAIIEGDVQRSDSVSPPLAVTCASCCGSHAARGKGGRGNGKGKKSKLQRVGSDRKTGKEKAVGLAGEGEANLYRDILNYHQSLLDYVSLGSTAAAAHLALSTDSRTSTATPPANTSNKPPVSSVVCCFGCGTRNTSNASSLSGTSEMNNNKGLPLTQMIVAKGQPLSTSMLSLVPPGSRKQPLQAESVQAAAAPHGVPDVRAQGDGLIKAVVGQPAQFTVDSRDSHGELRVSVEGPNSLLKNRIEQDHQAPGHYTVSYVPVEVGIHIIAITWNKATVGGNPYEVNIVDPRKVSVAGGWPAILDNNRCVPLIVNELKRIEFITREAGQGDLTATVSDPHGSQLIVRIDKSPNKDRQAIEFIPRVEGEHVIMVFYAGLPLPESPLQGLARFTSSAMPSVSSSATDTLRGNYPRVVLTGLGLQDAYVRETNEFVVDGTDAGPGELRVTMVGMKEDINVTVTPLGNNKYRCTYTPQHTGFYQLDVLWSGQPVRGSPYRVTVSNRGEASQVKFAADSMLSSKVGVGREVTCIVDTRQAGPGMLTAVCDGPTRPAICELKDRQDDTFVLVVVPQETGRHVVSVKYANEHVPGSPMVLQVGEGMPDPSKVKVFGSGIEDGLLATYQSHFVCDTRGAGAGQLTVRVRGPKGAFRVEMQRESQKDRIIDCRYDPTEPGEYEVSVKWSGVDVPGSPFRVRIFNHKEQLEQFYARYPKQHSRPIGVAQHPVMGIANGSHNTSFAGEE